MKLLISRENVLAVRPISKSISNDRVEYCIKEAHQIDLLKFLGNAFYTDYMIRFDNSGDSKYADYQALLKDGTYTVNGIAYTNPGLTMLVSYFATIRLYAENDINVGRFGLNKFESANAKELEDTAKVEAINSLRSVATQLQNQIADFLNNNQSKYPLYSGYTKGRSMENDPLKFHDPQASWGTSRYSNSRTIDSL